MRVLYSGSIEISWSMLLFFFFVEGRKTREPREKPLEQGENQKQTEPTYGTRLESSSGDISGKRALLHSAISPPPPPPLDYD